MHLRKKILSVVLAGAMIGGELLTGIGSFSLNVSAADSSFAGEEWANTACRQTARCAP